MRLLLHFVVAGSGCFSPQVWQYQSPDATALGMDTNCLLLRTHVIHVDTEDAIIWIPDLTYRSGK